MKKSYFYSIYHTKAFASIILEKIFFGWVSLVSLLSVVTGISLIGISVGKYGPVFLGIFSIFHIYIALNFFIYKRLRDPSKELLLSNNWAEYLDFEMAEQLAKFFPRKLTYVQLFTAAARTRRGAFIFYKMGLETDSVIERVEQYFDAAEGQLPIDSFWETVMSAHEQMQEPRISGSLIIWVFFQQGGIFEQILNNVNLSMEDFLKILDWEVISYYNSQSLAWGSPDWIRESMGTIGRNWTTGYTNDLDNITDDITRKISNRDKHTVIIHQDIIHQVLQGLYRQGKNNILLIGDAGVGKSSLVENLAWSIYSYQMKNNRNPSRVLRLHNTDLLSGVQNSSGYLLNALNYAESSGNIILVIEEISQFLNSSDPNIQPVIIKFLQSPRVNVIGLDYPEGYHTAIKPHPTLESLFQRIDVPDASEEETINVLMMNSFIQEKSNDVHITFQSIKAVMKMSERYMTRGGYPGKAVEILSDAVDACRAERSIFVLESHIRKVLSTKINMNLNVLEDNERKNLLSLEENLHREIKGQDEALTAISNALKRARVEVASNKKPIGTFLFLGPTGVGKTETAKALAKLYFGSKDRMIRLDMNEFSQPESLYGIIGAPAGQGGSYQEGFLTKHVQDRPFSLILLDEIEKAHSQVLNVFLQILDEGFLIDNRGVRTDFRNTIIIATSNAGAVFLRDFLKKNPDFNKKYFKEELIDEIIRSELFSPEFINRFTDVIVYYPLSMADVADIARKMIVNLEQKFFEERGVSIQVADDAIEYIATKGYSQDFGARELERTITIVLENYLANYLLLNNVQRGDRISITLSHLNGTNV